ncbi:MAG: CcoQ/FixQ family Cbb3-type cytochrome c oxidase assembly chaperone [Gammaproteobacteria bacterium]|nr:CcoQ/FixQ family Cbb3-type cytochrome c oxidase assembly chaperone [Gammaproteobacteria bacterium]
MFDWLEWFTHMENSKPFALVVLFVGFVGVIIYLFTGKKRGERLESYKNMPFLDDDDDLQPPRTDKGEKNE